MVKLRVVVRKATLLNLNGSYSVNGDVRPPCVTRLRTTVVVSIRSYRSGEFGLVLLRTTSVMNYVLFGKTKNTSKKERVVM